jgi:hypothetical protein
MARNVQFQILRGVQGNIQSAMPLALGEMYFGTDTGNLFFGTPGVGIGYIQLGDTTQVNERLEQLIVLMECVRRALVTLACEGTAGRAKELDFDPATISEELAASAPVGR